MISAIIAVLLISTVAFVLLYVCYRQEQTIEVLSKGFKKYKVSWDGGESIFESWFYLPADVNPHHGNWMWDILNQLEMLAEGYDVSIEVVN